MATATTSTATILTTKSYTGAIFVILAYAWGFQDGANDVDLEVSDLYIRAATVAAFLLRQAKPQSSPQV